MSGADHNVLSLFVCIHPGVSSQNTRAEIEKPGPDCVFVSFFPTQMFGSTQETGHFVNIVHVYVCVYLQIYLTGLKP
jgi:hypothetical protein